MLSTALWKTFSPMAETLQDAEASLQRADLFFGKLMVVLSAQQERDAGGLFDFLDCVHSGLERGRCGNGAVVGQ